MGFLERLFRVKAVRQGDWWAVPLPFAWTDPLPLVGYPHEDSSHNKLCTVEFAMEPTVLVDCGALTLNRTRHTLEGRYLRLSTNVRSSSRACIIGEGLLTAPDHREQRLVGPHAFFQTALLATPESAD